MEGIGSGLKVGRPVLVAENPRTCRECGCTDNDCRGCIARTGQACYWVGDDLCSACLPQAKAA